MYDWASNTTKLAQAVKAVEAKAKLPGGQPLSEELVMQEYQLRGGLVLNQLQIEEIQEVKKAKKYSKK
jgi:hypothetical protein